MNPNRRTLGALQRVALTSFAMLVLGGLPAASSNCPRLPLDSMIEAAAPRVESFVLANGLRVHLVPKPGSGVAAIRLAYDVGSSDEPEGRGGVAHLFEHLMFKGSGRIPDGEHFRWLRDVGGEVGAATDYDTTEYWNTVPAHALRRALFAEADRMRSLAISNSNLDNQRAAIEEEGLLFQGVPYADAAIEFVAKLWAGTPYEHTPLGTPEELAAMDEDEARAFHATYYVPSNAVLVVVGAIDSARVRQDVEDLFGSIEDTAVRRSRVAIEAPREAFDLALDDPIAPFPVYSVAWHAVAAAHPDALPLALIDDLLMGHPDARLNRSLRGSKVLDAYSLSFFLRGVGLLNYVFAPRTFSSFEEIEGIVREAARELRHEGPSEEELCASRRHEQIERFSAIETNEGLAAAIAKGALLHGDPWQFATDLRRIEALDREAIQRVASEYLTESSPTLEIRPQGWMRWLKSVLEFLPSGVGASLEAMLL